MPALFHQARSLACLTLFLLGLCTSQAQSTHVTNPGTGSLPLDGPWLFHLGDNPAWSSPSLPDQTWKTLPAGQTWGTQGYPAYTGYAWYRLHLDLDGPGPPPSLYFPTVDDNYELFWNGQTIGLYGGFPPHARLWNAPHGAIYPLPATPGGSAHGTLALRVWKAQLASNDSNDNGGLSSIPILGDPGVLALQNTLVEDQQIRRWLGRIVLSSVVLAAGLISLLLYLRGTRDPLFLYLAIYLIADSASAIGTTLLWFRTTLFEEQVVNASRVFACNVSLWFILLHLFGMASERRWRRPTFLFSGLLFFVQFIDTIALFFWQFDSPALRTIDGVTTAIYTLIPAYLFVILFAGLRRRTRISLWPLAVAVSAYGLYNIVIDLTSQGSRFTGLHWSQQIDNWVVAPGGYPMGLRVFLDLFFLVALLLTVARQQAAERERQNAIALELKSAQEIQRVLVPETLPNLPGFAVAAVYQPASEVGGDFFQIIPLEDAAVLLVIGDVSGKGLKAAMTVSLIVGTIRTLADTLTSPAAILSGLNRRLVGRTAGGFATCLALRIAPTGEAILANAGHLPPFLNQHELAVEGSIPLGLVDDVTYDETRFHLRPSDRLTLYTDGLLEARNRAGELYGFDRVQTLLARLPTVDQIMQEASAFGQEDDITILSLTRTATRQELAA